MTELGPKGHTQKLTQTIHTMEENKGTESKYAGLSKGQIKKLKEKEKKEREAAAAAGGGEEAKVEVDVEAPAGDAGKTAPKGKKAKKGKVGGLSEAAKQKILDQQRAA